MDIREMPWFYILLVGARIRSDVRRDITIDPIDSIESALAVGPVPAIMSLIRWIEDEMRD